jgi:hypothetical protein
MRMLRFTARRWLLPLIMVSALAPAAPSFADDGPATTARRAAYEATKAEFGPESDEATAKEADLAYALIAEDGLKEGVDHLSHIRSIVTAKSGPDAPEVLVISAVLSLVMVNGGEAGKGEVLARDTLERAIRTRGDTDLVTNVARAGLGTALALRGRYAEAYPLLQGGYEGMGSVYGESSLEVRQIGTVLQNVTSALGYEAEATALRRRLAEPPPPGAPEPVVLLAASQNLSLLDSEHRYLEAVALGEPLVARLTRTRGAGHTSTLDAMGGLASAYASLERWSEAAALMQTVHAGYERARGADDLVTLGYAETLGLYLTHSETADVRVAGRARMIETIERRRRLQGPNAPQVVMTEVALGMSTINDFNAPDANLAETFKWMLEADRALASDPSQAHSISALAVNVLIGIQMINQHNGPEAYARLSRAANVVRTRSVDRRVAANGADATGLLTQYHFIFVSQVRAGWLYAHQP